VRSETTAVIFFYILFNRNQTTFAAITRVPWALYILQMSRFSRLSDGIGALPNSFAKKGNREKGREKKERKGTEEMREKHPPRNKFRITARG